MFSGLFSFLGGAAFRWLLGEALGFLKARDERKAEIERLRIEHEQDGDRHRWQQEAIAAQAAQGIRVIEAQATAAGAAAADAAFLSAVQGVSRAGERSDWIGAWNASIRPALATMGILLLAGNALWPSAVILSPLLLELICAVLGVFVGERIRARGQ
jgi:hypothetical protein